MNTLTEKVMQYESKISKMTFQIQSFEKEAEASRSENEVMKRKIVEAGEVVKRINEADYKVESMTAEINRLNNIIENKNKENQNLQAKCL